MLDGASKHTAWVCLGLPCVQDSAQTLQRRALRAPRMASAGFKPHICGRLGPSCKPNHGVHQAAQAPSCAGLFWSDAMSCSALACTHIMVATSDGRTGRGNLWLAELTRTSLAPPRKRGLWLAKAGCSAPGEATCSLHTGNGVPPPPFTHTLMAAAMALASSAAFCPISLSALMKPAAPVLAPSTAGAAASDAPASALDAAAATAAPAFSAAALAEAAAFSAGPGRVRGFPPAARLSSSSKRL